MEKKPLAGDWKEVISKALKMVGVIEDEYDGELSLKIKKGGIRNARKTEELS